MSKPPEVNPPLTEEDRRPNDRPFYIDECCPKCGTLLIYEDLVRGETNWNGFCFDEFMCPKCRDSAHLDWAPNQKEVFHEAFSDIDLSKCTPYTEEMSDRDDYLIEGFQ